MSRPRPLVIALINVLIIALGMGLAIRRGPGIAGPSSLSEVRSITELYKLRDLVVNQIEKDASSESPFTQVNLDRDRLIEQLQIIESRILAEHTATDNWQQALRLAEGAEALSKSTIELDKEEALFLWEHAIENLKEIPTNSFLANQISPKIKDYKSRIITLENTINSSQEVAEKEPSNYLERIVKESNLSKQTRITICTLARECVNLRGDKPPVSPASLIKVPIAVAVMQKVSDAKINLDEKIYVKRGNFTEDASNISARSSYSLRTLVGEMIDHSSNIATNELIDYLGWNYINDTLKKQGYKTINVKFKLMGNRIMPSKPGSGRNSLTTNELTEMMVRIYNQETPSAKELIAALARQHDRLLGYQALAKSEAKWLGEKTGENSKVLGTTLAANIRGKIYIITVVDHRSGSDPFIRKCISKIADHILTKGHLQTP